jgi:hypothetical protein
MKNKGKAGNVRGNEAFFKKGPWEKIDIAVSAHFGMGQA